MTNRKNQSQFMCKVIIVGDSGVGKTNLLTKFCDDIFEENYVATIGIDFKLKTVDVDQIKLKLQIWDTAGQQRFRNITQTYFKGASAIILAYEINSLETFKNINRWIRQIESSSDQDVCKILVGTKIDLEAEREVQSREAKQFAVKHNMIFEQVSAKSGINVNEAFMMMAKEIKNRKMAGHWESQSGVLLRSSIDQSKKKCSC